MKERDERTKAYTRAYAYEEEEKYEYAMFLDADTLCLLDVARFLRGVELRDAERLCVFKESSNVRQHQSAFFGPKKNSYTANELKFFESRGVYPFNAGCFLFMPSAAINHVRCFSASSDSSNSRCNVTSASPSHEHWYETIIGRVFGTVLYNRSFHVS